MTTKRTVQTRLALTGAFVLLASCNLVSCPGQCVGTDRPLLVSVVDAQGNAVPIQELEARVGNTALDCQEGGPMKDGDLAVTYYAECKLDASATVSLSIVAGGQAFEKEIDVELRSVDSACDIPTFDLVPTEVALPGAGCAEPEGPALEGTLRGRSGEILDGAVSVYIGLGSGSACEVQQGSYACPALSPYPATYRLSAHLGTTRLERFFAVDAEDCLPIPVDGSIDLSEEPCPEPRQPSVAGNVLALAQGLASSPLRVQVSAVGVEETLDCEVVHLEPRGERTALYSFTCPALTPSGGGEYELRITQGESEATYPRQVGDDGCEPRTSLGNILDFPLEN